MKRLSRYDFARLTSDQMASNILDWGIDWDFVYDGYTFGYIYVCCRWTRAEGATKQARLVLVLIHIVPIPGLSNKNPTRDQTDRGHWSGISPEGHKLPAYLFFSLPLSFPLVSDLFHFPATQCER